MLPADIKPAMQGAVPATLFTCGLDGMPNATVISQVYWVDEDHVALSFQFFSKTIRNVRENPFAFVEVVDPRNGALWRLDLQYVRSEESGRTFEEMEMQLEAIATAMNLTGVFKLKAADIYHVLALGKLAG